MVKSNKIVEEKIKKIRGNTESSSQLNNSADPWREERYYK
jgi:hypothetical protein